MSRRGLITGAVGVAAVGAAAAGWAALSRSGVPASAAQNQAGWVYQTGGPVTSGAALDGEILYIGGQDGHIYVLGAADGHLIDAIRTDSAVTGPVTVAPGLVVASTVGGRVHGLPIAPASHKAWTHDIGAPVRGQAAVANGTVYIGADDHYLYALDAKHGGQIWRTKTGGPIRSTPLAAGLPLQLHYVYAGSGDGQLYAFDARTGAIRWRYRTGTMNAGVMLQSGNLYFGSDSGHVYEMSSDGQALWTYSAGGAVQGTPGSWGQTVFVGSADSSVYALNMTNGTRIWSYRTGGPVRSGIALGDALVFAGSDDGYLYAIATQTGRLQWRYKTGGPIRSQILAANGAVYFGSLDHRVYAIAIA